MVQTKAPTPTTPTPPPKLAVAPTTLLGVPLRAPSVILLGPPGSGKTTALVTLLKAGLEVFVIVTEPTGVDSLIDACTRLRLSIDKLHWMVIPPARVGFDMLKDMADKVAVMNYEQLSNMNPTGGREKAQWFNLLAGIRDFKCDRTGQSYGSVMQFGPERAFALDSFSGASTMAWDITVGNKVTAHRGEWGTAMNMLQQFNAACCSNFKCIYVMTAHVERETDETTRGTKLMVSTLGSKLAPKIPREFSEVIYTYREGKEYFWSTMHNDVDLKHRALPLAPKLPPDFAPIVAAYRARLKLIGAPTAPTPGA